MKPAPPKPSNVAKWLYDHGPAQQLAVDYRMTGVDTAETVLILWNHKKPVPDKLKIKGGILGNPEVEVRITHSSIVSLTDHGHKVCREREEFEKNEADDLAEYKRLKEKFGA